MKTKKQMKIGRSEDYNELHFNEAYNKVLQWFFSFPDVAVSLSDLSENVNIAKTTANRIVSLLIEDEFLNREIIGKIWRLTCNQEHVYNYSKKIGNNIKSIYESGLVNNIQENFPNARAIVLFGSYRKGDDNSKSDIDIAVEVVSNESPKIIDFGQFTNFGFRENVKINLFVFSRNNIDLNMFSNIANGFVLSGFLEVRP